MEDNDKSSCGCGQRKVTLMNCGCELKDSNITQIDVDGNIVGIVGLRDILKWFYIKGYKPEDLTGDELLEEIRKLNYIPKGCEEIYKDAILREYKKYYEYETL
jgi:hypothetical protein